MIELLIQGLGEKQIAEQMRISRRTVKQHKANAMTRTGCRTSCQLVAFYIMEY